MCYQKKGPYNGKKCPPLLISCHKICGTCHKRLLLARIILFSPCLMCDHLDVIYGCFSYANTNLVVGNTIQHWVTVMGRPQKGTEQEGMGTSIQAFLPLFYADDGIVASSESARCQGAFDALTGLFGRVGHCTNKGKTVGMSCWPCHTPHSWSMEDYTWRLMGKAIFYMERLRQRLHYLE